MILFMIMEEMVGVFWVIFVWKDDVKEVMDLFVLVVEWFWDKGLS